MKIGKAFFVGDMGDRRLVGDRGYGCGDGGDLGELGVSFMKTGKAFFVGDRRVVGDEGYGCEDAGGLGELEVSRNEGDSRTGENDSSVGEPL